MSRYAGYASKEAMVIEAKEYLRHAVLGGSPSMGEGYTPEAVAILIVDIHDRLEALCKPQTPVPPVGT